MIKVEKDQLNMEGNEIELLVEASIATSAIFKRVTAVSREVKLGLIMRTAMHACIGDDSIPGNATNDELFAQLKAWAAEEPNPPESPSTNPPDDGCPASSRNPFGGRGRLYFLLLPGVGLILSPRPGILLWWSV